MSKKNQHKKSKKIGQKQKPLFDSSHLLPFLIKFEQFVHALFEQQYKEEFPHSPMRKKSEKKNGR